MKTGRKSYWETRIKPRLLEIAAWCRDGHTDKEMCKALRVTPKTFYKYKGIEKELNDALAVNKEIADINVENSLYKRANGFEYEETAKEVKKDNKGKIIFTHIKKTTKIVIPDVQAQVRWLKNRKPKVWRDDPNSSNSEGKPMPIKVEIIAEDGRIS